MSHRRLALIGLVAVALAAVALAALMLLVRMPSHGSPQSPASPRAGQLNRRSESRAGPSPDPIAHSAGVALGVNLPDGPSASRVRSFTRLVGVRPRIVMWYQDWDQPLATASQLQGASAGGAIPMISWDPIANGAGVPLSAIAAGEDDRYLISSARTAARWHRRLYIRFGHEMNLSDSPFGPGHEGNTAKSFIAAWRHVVAVFHRYGATNVEWVWSPNVYCEGKCPFTAFYPGNRWVDWVALDGYNYATVDDVPWMTFKAIFAPSYAILKHLTDRPVMIAETASTAQGGDKATWIHGIAETLASQMPRVRALVWFDRVKETDWRVNSSPAALRAFRQLITSPTFTR